MAQKAKNVAKAASRARHKPRPSDTEPRFSREFLKVNSARVTLKLMSDRFRRISLLRSDEISGTTLLRGFATADALDTIANNSAEVIIPGWPVLETFIDGALADLLNP